jgi:hypothetical protein
MKTNSPTTDHDVYASQGTQVFVGLDVVVLGERCAGELLGAADVLIVPPQ